VSAIQGGLQAVDSDLASELENTRTIKQDYSEKMFVTCAEKLVRFGNGHKTGRPKI
jgi:hypothetical protein